VLTANTTTPATHRFRTSQPIDTQPEQIMINENELRIGNWIIDEDGEKHQITAGMFSWMDWSLCDPIVLTPEILEELKFKIIQGVGFQYYSCLEGDMKIDLSHFECYVSRYDEDPVPFPCKYLHQLQNLYFALTGMEL
jgi:hypothetical protein